PVVEEADFLVAMNIPSMDYLPLLRPGGTLLANSSLVTTPPARGDIRVVMVPATEMSAELKDRFEGVEDTKIAANSVMFGAYLAVTGEELDEAKMSEVFAKFLVGRKASYIPLNMAAVRRGFEYGSALASGQKAAPTPL
ncbi:MAG TPA: 2-oxoacid:acceptor oxidoreductase family protein, partial [Nitrososphaerales archaeon]|nr:2-oxoacid:acceptor oxidoreductase family protein [Nitrososphaerales archaeon]